MFFTCELKHEMTQTWKPLIKWSFTLPYINSSCVSQKEALLSRNNSATSLCQGQLLRAYGAVSRERRSTTAALDGTGGGRMKEGAGCAHGSPSLPSDHTVAHAIGRGLAATAAGVSKNCSGCSGRTQMDRTWSLIFTLGGQSGCVCLFMSFGLNIPDVCDALQMCALKMRIFSPSITIFMTVPTVTSSIIIIKDQNLSPISCCQFYYSIRWCVCVYECDHPETMTGLKTVTGVIVQDVPSYNSHALWPPAPVCLKGFAQCLVDCSRTCWWMFGRHRQPLTATDSRSALSTPPLLFPSPKGR